MIPFLAIVVGFIVTILFPGVSFYHVPGYEYVLYTLLGIGLYGAVHGIDLAEFHIHKKIIFRAVTLGVLVKSLLVGGILWLIFHTPYAFLFGIIVAQIDPLSVAHLIGTKSIHFSKSGRTILRAWSSFDDPMTVLLALYLYLPFIVAISQQGTAHEYLLQLGLNGLFAFLVWIGAKISKDNQRNALLLLLCAFLIAIPMKLMLGIALVGLFLRPTITILPKLIHWAFVIAAFLLGSLITITPTIVSTGIVLGMSAFIAQMMVTPFVAPRLSTHDKLFLAFGQYNGITSIILALLIAQWIPEVVGIIAIAIIVINSLYYTSNWLLEKKIR